MKGTQEKAANRPNPKRDLCKDCKPYAQHAAALDAPKHLVHPQTGKPNIFDVHGHAVCRNCGAKYHLGLRGLRMVD